MRPTRRPNTAAAPSGRLPERRRRRTGGAGERQARPQLRRGISNRQLARYPPPPVVSTFLVRYPPPVSAVGESDRERSQCAQRRPR